ncbi:hypothetical protein OH492_28290 [Vibrio chagasii]|nr:hypothetical protein [Vibrio chagasii]
MEVNGKVIELNTEAHTQFGNGYIVGTMPLAYRKMILAVNRHRGQLFSVPQLKKSVGKVRRVTNSYFSDCRYFRDTFLFLVMKTDPNDHWRKLCVSNLV